MAKFCSNCGNQMADSDAVCAQCGRAVGVGGGAAAAPAASSSGLTPNVAGLLAYLFIPAIIFLIIEPYNRDRFVKFHSWQSIILSIAVMVISFAMGITIILALLTPFLMLAHLIIAIVAAIKAYQGQMWKIPIIGNFAEKQANS